MQFLETALKSNDIKHFVSDPFDKPLFNELALQAKIERLEVENGRLQLELKTLVEGMSEAVKLADEGWAYVTPWVQKKWEFRRRIEELDLLLKEKKKWLVP